MSKFNGIVALTQAEYNSLSTNGSLTIGTTTLVFDEYTLYMITDSPVVYSKEQVDALFEGSIGNLENRVLALEGLVAGLQTNKANNSDLPTIVDIAQSAPSRTIQYNTLPNGSQEAVYSGPVTINTLPNGSNEYILGGTD